MINEQQDNTLDEQITYGIDECSPDGDYTAISIKQGNKLFTFVGEEAEVIIALVEQSNNRARIKRNHNSNSLG